MAGKHFVYKLLCGSCRPSASANSETFSLFLKLFSGHVKLALLGKTVYNIKIFLLVWS